MSFYSNLATTTARLLTAYGASATLTRVTPGSYDPDTGTVGTGTTATYTGSAAMFDYEQRDIDGTMIRHGDRRMFLQKIDVIPQTGDLITFNGSVFTVLSSRPTDPAGLAVLHELQVRGV